MKNVSRPRFKGHFAQGDFSGNIKRYIITELLIARSHWSMSVFRREYVNTVVTFWIRAYFFELFYKSNRAFFPCK